MRPSAFAPFMAVADDLDWLWNEWWLGQPDKLSLSSIRRGSASLHLLLNQGLLGRAWRAAGFPREPRVEAPDLEAIAVDAGVSLARSASCVAGGGRQNGVEFSFIGAFRVAHPKTGVPADADEGFAVLVTSVVRLGEEPAPRSTELDLLCRRSWCLSEYLASPSATRRGRIFTRAEIIEYFRNFVGGAHHDVTNSTPKAKREKYEQIAELEHHLRADVRDGLHFELLSIGQAVARSEHCRALSVKLRARE
jgi:hypothetical protein